MKDENLPEQGSSGESEEVDREQYEILEQIEDILDGPVLILGFIWLILLVIELIWELNPFLNTVVYFIWAVFILDFLLRFVLAPRKIRYLKRNWLTALSLAVPALRIARFARVLRVARAARSLRLVSVVSSVNRGMRSLRKSMQRRGFGYVALLTLGVTLVGAAGMLTFERGAGSGIETYGQALWWTAMIMTTMGSNAWPVTAEGRLLTFLLSLYAFGVFGYVTATLASFFIGQEGVRADTAGQPAQEMDPPAGAQTAAGQSIAVTGSQAGCQAGSPENQALRQEIQSLQAEVRALRADIRALVTREEPPEPPVSEA